MKIMYVTNLYGDNARGGAEKIVEREARAMLLAGHQVTVVRGARNWAEHYGSAGQEPDVLSYVPSNLYFYADDHKHGIVTRFFWHLIDMFNGVSAAGFERIFLKERPDVVHTHNLMGLGFMIPALLRAYRKAVPHVHTVHDVQLLHPSGLLPSPEQDHRGFAARAAQGIYVRIMARLMGSPNTVIFPSAYLRDLHVQRGFFPYSRKVVLANPVPAAVAERRTPPAQPRFTFVGQLERHKGVLDLAAAWKIVALSGAALEYVGDGAGRADLETAVAGMSGVQLRGRLSGEELLAAYDRSAFAVVPSQIIENQPTVILEAFSRGTPVVAAAVGGIPELVREGETGFLYKPNDLADLGQALLKAAAVTVDADAWQKMSDRCREWAAAHGTDGHVAALLEAYAQRPAQPDWNITKTA